MGSYYAECEMARETNGWQPIETAPTGGREMFVVKGFNVRGIGGAPYTTDPYCVWREGPAEFARWPHPFMPTHWMPLPAPPKT